MYYAITGQCPTNSFDRKYDQEKLVPPKQLVPSLSDAVNEAILQGMALEAKDRPQTMEEWLNLLSSSQANLTEVILASDVGVNYQNLENLLKTEKWKAADEKPDAFTTTLPSEPTASISESIDASEQPPEGEYQTVTLEELFVMLREDENLRQQIAQQLAVETDDPQVLVQVLINQLYPAGQSTTEQTEN